MTQANSNEVQMILDEFKNICPEITRCSLFKEDGDVLASSQEATKEEGQKTVAAFTNIAGFTEALKGMKTLRVQGPDSQLTVLSTHNHFLATVSSRAASNEKAVNSLTCVVVPTVLDLMNRPVPSVGGEGISPIIEPAPASEPEPIADVVAFEPVEAVPSVAGEDTSPIIEPEPTTDIGASEPLEEETVIDQSISEDPVEYIEETSLLSVPAKQLMVEKIGGLMVAQDVVRLDGDVIKEWRGLYDNKQIREVEIQTLEGKATSCKFKVTKENDRNSKGKIQIPDKLLQALKTNKGNLVIVKPVIT